MFTVRLALSPPPTYLNTINRDLQEIQGSTIKTDVDMKIQPLTTASTSSTATSPVNSSPYIPISECITGRSPILPGQKITDFHALLQHNVKNSFFRSDVSNMHNNDTYDTATPTYLNFNASDPRFYDCPRLLQPPKSTNSLNRNWEDNCSSKSPNKKNVSPLQSPTDSESVFTDDDWSQNTTLDRSSNPRPSSSSVDVDLAQKINKISESNVKLQEINLAPPRPPKPAHVSLQATYHNIPLNSNESSKEW